MTKEEEQELLKMTNEDKKKIYPTTYRCSKCGIELQLKDLWYIPYSNERLCERCYTIEFDRKIYKPCPIKVKHIEDM